MAVIGSSLPKDWGTYRPAELTVRLKSPEMETDWLNVYDDLGFKRPSSFRAEISSLNEQAIADFISSKAQEGDRIANISANEKNVFGNIAFERYMRRGQKEVRLEALPKQGVIIDFRIYPPEIDVNPRGVLPK